MALAVLEVLLRVYNPLEIRFRPDRIVLPVHKRYVFDNTEKFPTKLAKTTIHTKNSLGFRGEAPPRDFRDYLTIITIGGSTTECFYLSDGRTWPDLLGQNLSREFNRVWVNNAGLDGATTYRHLILMEDYVVTLRPKVVLFLMGINDVGAGDIAAAEERRGHDLRHRWHALLYRSEVYALGQNLYRYFIAQSRGLHHTEIDLRKAGTLDHLPAGTASRMLQDYGTNSLPFFAHGWRSSSRSAGTTASSRFLSPSRPSTGRASIRSPGWILRPSSWGRTSTAGSCSRPWSSTTG